jgi:hypothetical protein
VGAFFNRSELPPARASAGSWRALGREIVSDRRFVPSNSESRLTRTYRKLAIRSRRLVESSV